MNGYAEQTASPDREPCAAFFNIDFKVRRLKGSAVDSCIKLI